MFPQNANKVVQLCPFPPPPPPSDEAGAEFVDLMIWKILVVCNFVQNFLCSQTRTQFDKKHNRLLSKRCFLCMGYMYIYAGYIYRVSFSLVPPKKF